MGRDMRDPYRPRRGGDPQDERESPRNRNRDFSNGNSYEREEYSSAPPRGRPEPRGERSYDSTGQRRPSRPPLGDSSSGPGRGNSMVRQSYAGREPADESAYSNRGPSRPGGSTDDRNGGTPGGGGYDTPDHGGSRNGRSRMAEMARNVSKSMSRQLSSVMSRVGHAMEARPRMDPYARGVVPRIYSNLSEEDTLRLRAQAYRRSRIRLVARKWRLGRVRPNPIVYLVGIMTAIVLVVMLSVGGGAGGVYAVSYYQRHLSDIQAIAGLRDQNNSTIYDRNGTPIYFARGDKNFQTYVPLSQINLKVQAATIDTEDHTFYTNDGVDLYGTLRAALADVRAGGQATQGGSTITQQLVKNIVLDDSHQTIQRKLNEAILAYGVTQQYTKAFILEMYLNTIDYGELNTGIEAAARNFFNLTGYTTPKGVFVTANEQLSWAQAAILAALPNAPTEYQPDVFSCPKAPCQMSQWSNPFVGNPADCGDHISTFGQDWYTNQQNGHEWLIFCRAELVLYNIYQYGVPGHADMDLTYDEYKQQVQQVANILINQQVYSWQNTNSNNTGQQSLNLAPHFVEYVANELADQFGITDLTTAGLSIYTTLDLRLQQESVKVIQHYIEHSFYETWYPAPYANNPNLPLDAPISEGGGNAHNGALVAIDQRDGDILAMVGSVDYNSKDHHVQGANNITISKYRKMGSATKPLMYATAFQMGWTPGVMLQDEPVCFPNAGPTDPFTGKPIPSPVAPACKGWYVPQDYEEQNYSGTFPLRSQFDGSLNIAATEGMEFVGATPATSGNFISMVDRLGVTTIEKNAMGPTTALGDQPIPLLQLTGAYGTLANLGRRAPPRAILKITKADGTVLWQAPGMPQTQQVISAQAAYMVTSVLTDNPARAPFFKVHNPLVLDDDSKYAHIAIAGKTGTSSGNGGPDDIVTAGYTPYMTLGVWVGNTDGNDPLNPSIIGIAGAGYIFHDVMDWAANHYNWDPNATFTIPPDMARGGFNCNTGLAPYQGSTDKDLNCAWNPLNIVKGYTSYDPYLDNGTDQTHRPDTDWYIMGDQPITS